MVLAQKLSQNIGIYPYPIVQFGTSSWWIPRYRSLAFLNAMALQLQGLRVELNEEKTIKLKASKAQELPAYVWILGLARFFGCIYCCLATLLYVVAKYTYLVDISWKFPCFSVVSRLIYSVFLCIFHHWRMEGAFNLTFLCCKWTVFAQAKGGGEMTGLRCHNHFEGGAYEVGV